MSRSILLAIFVVTMILLSDTQVTQAQAGQVSGSFPISIANNQGTSDYLVKYSYPTEGVLGKNLTVTVTIELVQLTGLKLYLDNYSTTAYLTGPNGGFAASGSVNPGNSRVRIYPGGHWGPVNITLPLVPSRVGLLSGGSEQANLTITILTSVWYDEPLTNDFPESGSRSVGSVLIQSPVTGGNSAYAALVLGGAVGAVGVAIAALLAFRGKSVREKPLNGVRFYGANRCSLRLAAAGLTGRP